MPPIFKFVLFVMVMFVIIYFLVVLQEKYSPLYRDFCRNDFDCPSNQRCIYDRDYDDSICVSNGTADCGLIAGKDLQECDPTDKNVCANSCVNQPPFLCRVVTSGRLQVSNPGVPGTYSANSDDVVKGLAVAYPVAATIGLGTGMTVDVTIKSGVVVSAVTTSIGNNKYNKNDVLFIVPSGKPSGIRNGAPKTSPNAVVSIVELANPFVWKQGTTVIPIPNSNPGKGWCLPDVKQKSCNQFTSTSVLTEILDSGKPAYSWDCHCNNPLMFDRNPGGDCIVQKACSNPDGLTTQPLKSLRIDPSSGKSTACAKDSDCDVTESCLDNSGNPSSGSCDSSANPCFCYENWSLNKNSNPMDAFCVCGLAPNTTQYSTTPDPFSYQKLCVTDTCQVPDGACPNCKCQIEAGNQCTECGCDLAPGLPNTWDTHMPCDALRQPGYYSPDPSNPEYWYGHMLGCQVDGKGNTKCVSNPCNSDLCYVQFNDTASQPNFSCIIKDLTSNVGNVFANNPVGQTCIDLCNDGKTLTNGVIEDCGDRGTCTVVTDPATGERKQTCGTCKNNYANGPGDVFCQTKLSDFQGPCMCNIDNNGCASGLKCSGPCNFGTSGSMCCHSWNDQQGCI